MSGLFTIRGRQARGISQISLDPSLKFFKETVIDTNCCESVTALPQRPDILGLVTRTHLATLNLDGLG
jgi:hypothetical protein